MIGLGCDPIKWGPMSNLIQQGHMAGGPQSLIMISVVWGLSPCYRLLTWTFCHTQSFQHHLPYHIPHYSSLLLSYYNPLPLPYHIPLQHSPTTIPSTTLPHSITTPLPTTPLPHSPATLHYHSPPYQLPAMLTYNTPLPHSPPYHSPTINPYHTPLHAPTILLTTPPPHNSPHHPLY